MACATSAVGGDPPLFSMPAGTGTAQAATVNCRTTSSTIAELVVSMKRMNFWMFS